MKKYYIDLIASLIGLLFGSEGIQTFEYWRISGFQGYRSAMSSIVVTIDELLFNGLNIKALYFY